MKYRLISFGMSALVCCLIIGDFSFASELPFVPFEYYEDFEGDDPVLFRPSEGKHKVHFIGTTDEQAFSGKKSFKLDVTLKGGGIHYWSIPVKVPCAGKLKFSGRIRVETTDGAHVGLGHTLAFPPTHHSRTRDFDTFDKPTKGWRIQEKNLVQYAPAYADHELRKHTSDVTGENVGIYLDSWGIYIYRSKRKRVVIYIDDIRIEGVVPTPAAYNAELQKRFQPVEAAFQTRLARYQTELNRARKALKDLGRLPPIANRMRQLANRTLDSTESDLTEHGQAAYATQTAVDRLESNVKTARLAAPNISYMANYTVAQQPFVTYVTKPITNTKTLPTSFPFTGRLGSELSVAACRSEYEPAAFAVYALNDLKQLHITPTDLRNGSHTIPAANVDISIVKSWYQAGVQIWETSQRVLTPELLLKDDRLVRVDTEQKQNFLRTSTSTGDEAYVLISSKRSKHLQDIKPRDTRVLQPVDVKAETTRQFWVTVHVPPDAAAGEYTGKLMLTADEIPDSAMSLRLRVLPFDLQKPTLQYSIYYRGRLTPDGVGSISSEGKSAKQYAAEMSNLAGHGVPYPTIYQKFDEKLLPEALRLRQQAGLPAGSLFTLGLLTRNASSKTALESLRNNVHKWRHLISPFEYDTLYVYGIDEARGERLKSQQAAWKAVHDAGGKVFVACYHETFEMIGGLLNLAVLYGPPMPEEAEKYHSAGHRIFCYGNPQVGVEEPETYRRNFGLLLWKAGYDGAMNYAYQHSMDHIWNDFDHTYYRDHNFTYPTVNGVIDTIQWEGFREGVDDVRYLTTLLEKMEQTKAIKPHLVKESRAWLNELDIKGDLDQIRAKMVDWILKLQ